MSFNNLNVSAKKSTKRVGRGISAGQGKTAGRGTKGQKSRAGYSRKPGFEGGQTPLAQRFPKLRGFKSHHQKAEIVFTGSLHNLGTTVNNQTLFDAGLVQSPYTKVKIVVKGEAPKKKHTVTLQSASKTAIALLEKAGGSFKAIEQVKRPASKKRSDTAT